MSKSHRAREQRKKQPCSQVLILHFGSMDPDGFGRTLTVCSCDLEKQEQSMQNRRCSLPVAGQSSCIHLTALFLRSQLELPQPASVDPAAYYLRLCGTRVDARGTQQNFEGAQRAIGASGQPKNRRDYVRMKQR